MLTCHEVELFISFGKITDFIQRAVWLLVAKDPSLRIKDTKTHQKTHSAVGDFDLYMTIDIKASKHVDSIWFWQQRGVKTSVFTSVRDHSWKYSMAHSHLSSASLMKNPPLARTQRSNTYSRHLCFATTLWSTTKRQIPTFGRNFSRWCVL